MRFTQFVALGPNGMIKKYFGDQKLKKPTRKIG